MARIRSTHPNQWTDENFVALSFPARLLALAFRNISDDHGIFEWKPVTLKMQLFPADNIEIDPLLQELLQERIVMKFEADGKSYGAIRNFVKWQRPKKPSYTHPTTEPVLEFVGAKKANSGTSSEADAVEDGPVRDRSPTPTENLSQRKEVGGKGRESSEPNGSGSPPKSVNPEVNLFKRGKEVLGSSAGGVISQLKKRCHGNSDEARSIVEQAAAKENPMEWIQGVLRASDPEDMAYRNMV